MDGLFASSPWGRLSEVGINSFAQVFGENSGEGGENPVAGGGSGDLAYNGNPFAGENFWNIFAGGVNPSQIGTGGGFGGGGASS